MSDRDAKTLRALEEVREYLEDRADVIDGPEGYEHEQRPNQAMRLLMLVDDALGRNQ